MVYTLEEKYDLIKQQISKLSSANPIDIVKELMHQSFVSIHGPEHHFLDGAAFLAAYKNAGGNLNLAESLTELAARAIKMPGRNVRTMGNLRFGCLGGGGVIRYSQDGSAVG